MDTTKKVLRMREANPAVRASEIARKIGVSRERVRQILKSAGLSTAVPKIVPANLRAEYRVWWNMIDRCGNPDHPDFHHYGARGITVCARWRAAFQNFLADMGSRPSPRHSIERRNNALGYSPANCAWATKSEQVRNTRTSKLSEEQIKEIRRRYKAGETQAEIAEAFGVSQPWIGRIVRGEVWQ